MIPAGKGDGPRRRLVCSDFYRDRFAGHGIEVLVPDTPDRTLVDRVIFEELTRGILSDRSRQDYLRVIADLTARGAEGIILGCTEISLLITQTDVPSTPLYDTTALHVARAVELALERRPLPEASRRPSPPRTWPELRLRPPPSE